jgi:outer membrane immunogenic protein
MKKIILIGAAFAALLANSLPASPAIAADLPIEAPVYVERPAAVGLLNWTGFYIGANLGYARSPGSTHIMLASVPLFSLSENMSGVIGGIQAGANWQTGNAVFGIEADVQGTSQSVSSSLTVVDITGAVNAAGANVTAASSDKITSFGSVRGRLGIASGRALFYATGGWAYWTWSSNLTVTGLGTASFSNFQGGGTIGGGVEVAVASDWTIRAEYLYLQSTTISNTPFIARPDVIVNTRIRDNVFRVGVNYMFFTGSVGCRPHVC